MRSLDRRTLATLSCALVVWIVVVASVAGQAAFRRHLAVRLIPKHIGAVTFHSRLLDEAALSTFRRNGRFTLLGRAVGLPTLPSVDATNQEWIDAFAATTPDDLQACDDGIAAGQAEILADLGLADAASGPTVAALQALTRANQRLAKATCQLAVDTAAGARDLREYDSAAPDDRDATPQRALRVRNAVLRVRESMAALRDAASDAARSAGVLASLKPDLFGERIFPHNVDCLGASAMDFARLLEDAVAPTLGVPRSLQQDERTLATQMRDVYFCPTAP